MNKNQQTYFAKGYQCAMEDLATAWSSFGAEAAMTWLENNLAPDKRGLVAKIRQEMK